MKCHKHPSRKAILQVDAGAVGKNKFYCYQCYITNFTNIAEVYTAKAAPMDRRAGVREAKVYN